MSSLLQQEIYQQPDVLEQLINKEKNNIHAIARELSKREFKYILIAARGTSDNAARYAQYLFGVFNHIQVALATPSLFTIYERPPNISNALVIGISQSGQSPDIVSVLEEGKRLGSPTLAITNNIHSDMAGAADYVIPLHAGEEKAVAATKTYTASLAALALLSSALEGNVERESFLKKMPQAMHQTLANVSPAIQHVERYRYMKHCAVIGRGFNYSTAFEIALKMKELTYVNTEPYSSADFRHGPIATIDHGFPVILVAPGGAVIDDIEELIQRLQKLQAEIIIITGKELEPHQARLAFHVPSGIPEWLSPLVAVIPGQLFSLQLTIEKGYNPDKPRGLTKVTETY